MAKCRGFKPGGIENPYYYNKRKLVKPDGSTIKERLQRSTRPTWEEFRRVVNKTTDNSCTIDTDASKNDEYRQKLDRLREEKLSKMLNASNKHGNNNLNIENLEKHNNDYLKKKRSNSFDRSSPRSDY